MAYWFNVTTGQVEDDANKSRGEELMGPYETQAEAAAALQQARENTEKWDAADREWEGEDRA